MVIKRQDRDPVQLGKGIVVLRLVDDVRKCAAPQRASGDERNEGGEVSHARFLLAAPRHDGPVAQVRPLVSASLERRRQLKWETPPDSAGCGRLRCSRSRVHHNVGEAVTGLAA